MMRFLNIATVYTKPSNRDTEKFTLRYVHLDSLNDRDLKFAMYLSLGGGIRY